MGFYPLKCKCSSILINLAYIGDMLVKNALATSNLLNITSQCNLKHSLHTYTGQLLGKSPDTPLLLQRVQCFMSLVTFYTPKHGSLLHCTARSILLRAQQKAVPRSSPWRRESIILWRPGARSKLHIAVWSPLWVGDFHSLGGQRKCQEKDQRLAGSVCCLCLHCGFQALDVRLVNSLAWITGCSDELVYFTPCSHTSQWLTSYVWFENLFPIFMWR